MSLDDVAEYFGFGGKEPHKTFNSYETNYSGPSKERLKEIAKLYEVSVNALRYVKSEKDNTLDSYKAIDVEDLKEVYCNDDWYVITYEDGSIEQFNNSFDSRAELEQKSNSKNKTKILSKVKK